jgi:hypothetical protein
MSQRLGSCANSQCRMSGERIELVVPRAGKRTRKHRKLRKPCEPPRNTARLSYSKSLQTPNASAVFG